MTSSPPLPAVSARGLTYRYAGADGRTLLALDGVDLEVGAGEFVSVVGPSGCGKSTLLRLVAGLLPSQAGEVGVLGGIPAEAQRAHALGLVAQEPGLLPWRDVEANVRLPLDVTRAGDPARVQALLEQVGIAEFAGYRPGALSGGMRQRVALARALVHRPRLLLMDEPFGALDELSREAMRLELLRIWEQERIAVLFVTHSVAEAVLLSDRVVVMTGRPGRVRAVIDVPLSRPRGEAQEASPAFVEAAVAVRAALRSGDEDAA
ncbi:MAG: ABC transporter ATP-binding protein [Dehalococcoidia bacterium]|nr:MAG: ABC transporter ATP-binding protein [Dehalococcoidia bacterium]